MTSQGLLDEILTNRQGIYSLLKRDKVLIGMLLGYGEQNAIYVSRKEHILEGLDQHTPPFLPNNLIKKEYDLEFLPLLPSFGFNRLEDELNSLEEQTVMSSRKLVVDSPRFILDGKKVYRTTQRSLRR